MTPRLLGSMTGALIVLGLPAILPSSRPSPGAAWWEIRLSVTVKGDYIIKGGEAPLSGRFTCRARWVGTFEKDGDDVLLYRLMSETLEWDLVEKAASPKGESLEKAREASEKPLLRLNYILRDGLELRFDYEFREVSIPLHASAMTFDLEFPSSRGPGTFSFVSDYGDFVRRGSNHVVIPDSDLDRHAAERTFSWEWRQDKRFTKDARDFVVTQRHAAEAVVSLIAH